MTRDIIAVLLCLMGSGFFSASETALTSLPVTRLEALRRHHGRLTRAGLDRWATAPQELLITILVVSAALTLLVGIIAIPKAPAAELPPFSKVSEGYEKVTVSDQQNRKGFFDVWQRKKDAQLIAELPKNFATKSYFIALTISSGAPS